MERGEHGRGFVPRVKHDESWTRAQADGHQLVTRAEGDDGCLLFGDPGAYVRRERSAVGGKAYRVRLLQIVGFPVAGDSALSEEKERHCQYRIRQKQKGSFEPV
jgi:hypothetical protein